MKLTVHGAARTTTGSMYLLEVCGKRILFECGFFQGKRKESLDRNREFPFKPGEIDVALLSHAHIDHCGNFPNLVRQGYKGAIFCNHATRDLATLMLEDSAHIQEADCGFINRRNAKLANGAPPAEPLYTVADARITTRQFVSVDYERPFEVVPGVTATFREAGHILGSAQIMFDLNENGRKLRLMFSADLGRGNNHILKDPTPFEDVEVLILESTYGARLHEPIEEANTKLASVINRAMERQGKVIIPAFSIDRTQQIVYSLHELTKKKLLPNIPIYVDSPLSVNATEIFLLHPECFNLPTYEMLRRNENPFGMHHLTYIRTADESKRLNARQEPCIIISASGMCEAGRIRHHLRNNLGNPRNIILIVGFCAPNTLGAALAAHEPVVSIFGEKQPVKAQIEIMDAFSAHADRNEILDLVRRSTGPMHKIILTHGQPEQAEALAKTLQVEHPQSTVLIPDLHDVIEL